MATAPNEAREEEEEAILEEEKQSQVVVPAAPPSQPQNAFTKLMAPKPKRAPAPARSKGNVFRNSMALGAYIEYPESFPSSVVIYHNDDFVALHDAFPKATVHILLLPKSKKHQLLHPIQAFEDKEFLAKVQTEVEKLKNLVAKELQRKIGQYSKAEAEREAFLNEDDRGPPSQPGGDHLPAGRDWSAEIMSGFHAVPSMSHLHIHVLSRDMHSPKMKHRKHYNSFNTPFLVDLKDCPLSDDDGRRRTGKEGYLGWDLKCWRCGKVFKDRFAKLKEHLEDEFEEWKKE